MAVTLEVCGSISICTSTVSGTAPFLMARAAASFLILEMSSVVGLGMTRSTTSRIMASATPIELMTSAYFGML